jgi:hypothetical protein
MRTKYIGITDVPSAEAARTLLEAPAKRGVVNTTGHKLGVGVMMSWKTLNGVSSRWSGIFPPNERVADIFIDDPRVFNILHYADYENLTSRDDIRRAIRLGGPNIHALQLDMPWPDMVTQCAGVFLETRDPPTLKVILQVGSAAMSMRDNDPKKVARTLAEYWSCGFVEYVLLDRSMGEGRTMDAHLLGKYLHEIRRELPNIGIVVAGGLGTTSLTLLEPFRQSGTHKDLSIDAQGRLRPSGSARDPLDLTMAEEYYVGAHEFFNSD